MSEARLIETQLVVNDGNQQAIEGRKSSILVSNLPDGTNSQMIREIFSKCAVQILYVEIETDSALVHCYWTKELRGIVEEMTGLSLQGGTILKLELFEDDEAAKRREVNRKETRIPSSLLIVFGFDTSRISKSNISEVFSKVARVQKVMIRSKFCFVRFKNIESSTQAMEEYHGKEVLGSMITIEYGMTGVAQSAPEAAPSAGEIVLDTTTNLRKSDFHDFRKLQDRQFQCRKDRELSCAIKNNNSKNSRRRDRSRSRDGRPGTSSTSDLRYRADRSEVDHNIPKFLSTESRIRQRDAHCSATR
jgi:RNA recognition motif-containing protein